ncbi:hypothetical protein [Paracraurococcus lichenis]|uniref:Secreted protein n=1 Tax=Paracraurococcus lichenis TaxID=3064888 RepID=A0ABT9EBU1_9PROT|nr:hypothetical protein [Paracraurococcus sp. LOR1-02]MDO9713438.1 hypothetical protein [Paracraurococcus sp. LOR1-02]
MALTLRAVFRLALRQAKGLIGFIAVPSAAAETTPTQRDVRLRCIAKRGCTGWRKVSGHNDHALIAADISRWKRVIGGELRSQTDGRQATEVSIATGVLNRMPELVCQNYVRFT